MRTTSSLMNGALIGFGIGFIAASFALQRLVVTYLPEYAILWQFRGVAIVGVIGLAVGLGLEIYERLKMKKRGVQEQQ